LSGPDLWPRQLRRCIAGLLAGCCAAGCAGREEPEPTPTLRIGRVVLPDSLDPNGASYSTVEAISHIYEGLVRYDRSVAIEPALAQQWEAKAPDTWLLHLREGVRFHDGTAFTASEAKRAIDAVLTDPEASGRQWLGSIEAASVDGEFTLRLETRVPEPLLLQRLARFKIARRGPSGEPIGTGPYRVSRWQPGRALDLEAFDGYWGAAPAAGRVQYVRLSAEEAAAAITEGRVDIAAVALESGAGPIQSLRGPSLTRMFLWFADNSDRAVDPFDDRRVRQAIALALNREQLSAASNGYPGFEAWQLVPPGLIGHDPSLSGRGTDVAEARSLLAAAGWADGFEVPLVHVEGGGRSEQTAAELLPMLAEIGIRAEARAVPMKEIIDVFGGNGRGLLLSPWTFDDGDAGSFLRDCVHSRSRDLGLFNPGSHTKQMDARIEAALAELDPLVRQASYQELMSVASELVPVVPLFDHAAFYAVAPQWRFRPRADAMILAHEFTLAE
jgi:peptide/nickel transport system substrate-binding protein